MIKKTIFPLFFLITFLTFASVCIINMFYEEDVKNILPTEIPTNYIPTFFGQKFNNKTTKKLKLLHFFNPTCPCSKFNTKHILELKNAYLNDVEFIAYSTQHYEGQYPIPVIIDKFGYIAQKYGVYSTPQAVLLDENGQLLYRGNYNKSRYCSNKETKYVVNAIELALKNIINKNLMQTSGLPYGCKIIYF